MVSWIVPEPTWQYPWNINPLQLYVQTLSENCWTIYSDISPSLLVNNWSFGDSPFIPNHESSVFQWTCSCPNRWFLSIPWLSLSQLFGGYAAGIKFKMSEYYTHCIWFFIYLLFNVPTSLEMGVVTATVSAKSIRIIFSGSLKCSPHRGTKYSMSFLQDFSYSSHCFFGFQ